MNAALTEIIDSILSIAEFSSDDCDCLKSVLSLLLDAAPTLFTEVRQERASGVSTNPEVLLHEHVPNWLKFRELVFVLGASLQQLSDRWADGKGPLALYFTVEELKKMVIAIFENTSRREILLSQLR